MSKPFIPVAPDLTPEASLKTLVENRTIYNLENCELNLFETYRESHEVALKFNDLVVTSMLKGKKVMHLFELDGFDYLPGQSVIVPANETMRIDFPEASSSNPTQCIALAIDQNKIASILQVLNEKYPRNDGKSEWQLDRENFFFQNNETIATTINKLLFSCQSTDVFKDIIIDLSLQELLVKIIQTQSLQSISSGVGVMKNTSLSNVTNAIQQRLTDKIDLKTIAGKMGMSTSTLYRIFKREMGISPIEFIILERIKLAKKFLAEKGNYVKNASYESGFEDSNYFIRVFKHYEGITPKQYQQMLHKPMK